MTLEDSYRFFVSYDTPGSSDLYEHLGTRVLSDKPLLEMLDRFPAEETRPILFFAAVNSLGGISEDYDEFRSFVTGHLDEILSVTRARTIQTNEIGRCALFLAPLSEIEGPISLIEVGASGGLNLLPDHYAYDYGDGVIGDSSVLVRTDVRGGFPVPKGLPKIVWRAGIDVEPIDITDDGEVAWLEACIFADNIDRVERLRAAVDIARRSRPRVERGDLVDDLERLVAEAPTGSTVVVFDSVVLAWVGAEKLKRFVELVGSLDAVWLSLEPWFFIDGLRDALPRQPDGPCMLLGRNGREPLAFAHPHGRWVEWIGGP